MVGRVLIPREDPGPGVHVMVCGGRVLAQVQVRDWFTEAGARLVRTCTATGTARLPAAHRSPQLLTGMGVLGWCSPVSHTLRTAL